jgi:hypothetical protein
MKRLVCAALALSLIGSTAAVAQPYGRSGGWGGYSHQDRGDYRRGDNGAGLAIGLGVGLFALAAIAASQHHDRDYDRYDNRGYGYGGSYYGQGGYTPSDSGGYGGGYGSTYGNSGFRHGYDNYGYDRQGYGNYNYGGYGR